METRPAYKNPWFWTALAAILVLLITNLISLLVLGGRGGASGDTPGDVVPGKRIAFWASDGGRLVGRREVLQVQGRWIRVRIDEGGDPWEAWVNLDCVAQYNTWDEKK